MIIGFEAILGVFEMRDKILFCDFVDGIMAGFDGPKHPTERPAERGAR